MTKPFHKLCTSSPWDVQQLETFKGTTHIEEQISSGDPFHTKASKTIRYFMANSTINFLSNLAYTTTAMLTNFTKLKKVLTILYR